MRPDRIEMYVTDLDSVRDFFVKYFDALPGGLYHNPRSGFRSYSRTVRGYR